MKHAGEVVEETGLYRVSHSTHRAAHKAILWAGETFPVCRNCGQAASFQFLHPMTEADDLEHVGYDRDFLEAVLGYGSCRLSA